MTPVFAARRRAEEFHRLVEGTSTGQELRDADVGDLRGTELGRLALLARGMEAMPAVEARAEFVTGLRDRLLAEADEVLAPTEDDVRSRLTVAPRRTKRERRAAVALGGFAVVAATTSMAVASQSALPGDTLYPLKRAIEDARTGVQVDEDDKGAALLGYASGRLVEVDELTQRGADTTSIADTLQAFTDQSSEASTLLLADYEESGHASSIEVLRTFTDDSMRRLTALEDVVPPGARPSLVTAAQTVAEIDQQALYACPGCTDEGLTRLPDFAMKAYEQLVDDVEQELPPVAGVDGQGARSDDRRDPRQQRETDRNRPRGGQGSPEVAGPDGRDVDPDVPEVDPPVDPDVDREVDGDILGDLEDGITGGLGGGQGSGNGGNGDGGGKNGGGGGGGGGLGDLLGGVTDPLRP